jgi:signal transduction histidine kinase
LPLHVYLRLVVLTAGTLLPLFWIVVILGHRRQRNFERVFFFLCLALVSFFGASLLALNAQLYYSSAIPRPLARFAWIVSCVGLWPVPPLLVHLHLEYAQVRELLTSGTAKRGWLAAAYLPTILLAGGLYAALRLRSGFDYVAPSNQLGRPFRVWLVAAVLLSACWQWRFARTAPDAQQKRFHRTLIASLVLAAMWITAAHTFGRLQENVEAIYVSVGALFALVPLVALIRNVQRFNFLQIGRQRNLIYAVFAAFIGLLYLSFIRRASLWLEPYLPPEASAGILLFLPVVFFEPLQRLVGRILQRTAQGEMDRLQKLMTQIQDEARQGNLLRFLEFVGTRVKEQFELSEARIDVLEPRIEGLPTHREVQHAESFSIYQAGRLNAVLCLRPHGAALSGETRAALEFLCEQLPAAIDLCRLIEEKLRLERELAERERLALVGQTAASISHNLKNPLGSIKTILQVQLENPEMPESMRAETRMILEEIERLSAKLNQLLQFSRPTVRSGSANAQCDARVVVLEVSAVLRHEAERRGVALEATTGGKPMPVATSAETLNDIVSNLVVNALEAAPRNGRVSIQAAANGTMCSLVVEDNGAGIPESAREKILQPFFTTKAQGTGLGLAIVARRVAEFGGKLEWKSPLKEGRGTRFEVMLPMERGSKEAGGKE